MISYKVKLSNHILKQLDKIPKDFYLKIYEKMKSLSDNPRPNGCIKLTDSDDYRIRVGRFRILYEINDKEKIIDIYEILHRKESYKKR
jgi:mRNA interferase RelE/StbE